MITYQIYNEIRFLTDRKGMSYVYIARKLHLSSRTVKKWALRERYEPRKVTRRSSLLDAYKPVIMRDLVLGTCSSNFIFNRLKQAGYTGSTTILKNYLQCLRQKQPDLGDKFLLPHEWMLRLVQGQITANDFEQDIGTPTHQNNIINLLQRISDGPLQVRNKGVTILSYLKNIPQRYIAHFLKINYKMVGQYVQKYKTGGITMLFALRSGGPKKHNQEVYKAAVFNLLHSPPQTHGINRTSWRMADLERVLHQQGVAICKDGIRIIIKNAGYRFRSAKRVLTSTDPQYRDKLAELTRTLSGLSDSQRFFSIDEYGPFAVKLQGGRALTAPGQERIVPQWQKSKDAASWHASKAFLAEVACLNEGEYRAFNQSPSIALVPLPASAQFLNVIESVFSGMARAIIHNSDYTSVKACKEAIDKYFLERNVYFQKYPKRAGDKIWGKERVPPVFSPSNNCKDPNYR
jgi:transposase